MKVIKIGAEWCSGCLVMRPRWEEIEKEHPTLRTEYWDFDKDRKKMGEYGVTSEVLPVCIFWDKEGGEVDRCEGEVEKKRLLELIQKYKDR